MSEESKFVYGYKCGGCGKPIRFPANSDKIFCECGERSQTRFEYRLTPDQKNIDWSHLQQ